MWTKLLLKLMNQHHRCPDVSSPSHPSVSPDTYRPPSPRAPLFVWRPNGLLPQPHPLSCAAAVHKYINLVSVCMCAAGGVAGGMSTYRRRVGNPTGRPPFMCHQITDAQCLHIRSIQTHIQTRPNTTPAVSPTTCHPGCGNLGTKSGSQPEGGARLTRWSELPP